MLLYCGYYPKKSLYLQVKVRYKWIAFTDISHIHILIFLSAYPIQVLNVLKLMPQLIITSLFLINWQKYLTQTVFIQYLRPQQTLSTLTCFESTGRIQIPRILIYSSQVKVLIYLSMEKSIALFPLIIFTMNCQLFWSEIYKFKELV